MPVVSLNLSEQAYRAYIQVPKGRRSQVFSAIIEKRDLTQKTGNRSEGVLADLGFTTVGEAIHTLVAMNEAQRRALEHAEAD